LREVSNSDQIGMPQLTAVLFEGRESSADKTRADVVLAKMSERWSGPEAQQARRYSTLK
jgi:hypothetical protein